MSIRAKCQCGKSFTAPPQLAGKRVKCPACGNTLAIPDSAGPANPQGNFPNTGGVSQGDPLVQHQAAPTGWAQAPGLQSPLMQSAQQQPGKKASWKLPVFIGSGVAGIGVVALVVVLIVSAVGNSGPSDTNAERSDEREQYRSAIEEMFNRPPTQPDIIATGENWVPDKSLVEQLGPEVSLDEYSFRLPRGFEPAKSTVGFPREWVRSNSAKDDYGHMGFHANSAVFREDEIRSRESSLVSDRGFKVERGRLNGIPSYRSTISSKSMGKTSNICAYHVWDGDREVLLQFICYSPPDSEDYKLLDTAVRTLRRK